MNIHDIAKSHTRKEIFNDMLEESCRQWCDFIEEAPERKNGQGFASFFFEVFQDKEKEWIAERKNHREER